MLTFPSSLPTARSTKNQTRFIAYTSELLSLGLLYFEFKDAVKEGDGD